MTQNAVSINILSNVREAVRGADDVADAYEGVSDQLTELAKDGDKSTDRLEKDFRDLSKSADKNADVIRDKFRQAYRDMKNASDDAVDEAITDQRRLGAQSEEVGQEIRQNLGEGIANAARGDFSSLGDLIGDTLGGAVAGIGGIGTVAAGVAGAAGLGLIVAAISAANEETVKAKERVAEWAQAFIDSGDSVLTAGVQAARFQAIITDPEAFSQAEKNARDWGVSVETAIKALSGNEGAIEDVTVAVNAQTRAAEEANAAARDSNDVRAQGLQALTDESQAARVAAESLSKLTREMSEGQQRASVLTSYYEDLINSTEGATVEVDALGNSLYSLPDGTQVFVSAETGQASQNISAFKGDVDEVPEAVSTTVRFSADTSAVDRVWNALQARASRGIRVSFNNTGRMTWE